MFSRKVHYGLQFILAISVLAEKKYIGVSEIADKENLPVKFLETIAALLRKSGLVDVKRGAGGGYRLARPLKEISLFDVVSVLEEKAEKRTSLKSNQNEKATLEFASEIKKKYDQLLKSNTLEDLEIIYRKENDKLMFYI